jgi:hypothetical protein
MPQQRPLPAIFSRRAPTPALCLVAAVVFCCLAANPARAGVIYVGETHYRLEDGRKFLGPWDVTEETIMAKEAAVVVMEERADQRMVQLLLQTLRIPKRPYPLHQNQGFQGAERTRRHRAASQARPDRAQDLALTPRPGRTNSRSCSGCSP